MKKNKQDAKRCQKITLHGMVQGVGFRPFVHRLASEIGITGWVKNSSVGLQIEAEADSQSLDKFFTRLQSEIPPQAFIQSIESSVVDPKGHTQFGILESQESGPKQALILPDLAPCSDCLKEILDSKNRRYRYPFTNCTHCGPRFSIVEGVPYDRKNTSMKKFVMCPQCCREYENPKDRRFHAQPNACSRCGPQAELWDSSGRILAGEDAALTESARHILEGKIIAVKGVGGFHLLVDAFSNAAVQKLRERKHRETKPFALMFPDLDTAAVYCDITESERRLLQSPQAPIVILEKKRHLHSKSRPLSEACAPGNPNLGIMLPSSPLHYLLLQEIGGPVVATSGNLSEEPLVTDEKEGLERLAGIADYFLVHDRPIVRPLDDSIVRLMGGREMALRRARGYAPLPLVPAGNFVSIVAVGAHLKNTVAQNSGGQIFLSQHLGDLETVKSFEAFRKSLRTFKDLYETPAQYAVCDLNSNYVSTQYAEHCHLPLIRIQHHYAHALAGIADNEIEGPVLAVCWDGTGLGEDQTVWGGEFLRVDGEGFSREGHFRRFRLLGGDQAAREPRRAALAVLFEIFQETFLKNHNSEILKNITQNELRLFSAMLKQGIQSPWTTSAGRLFDAAAAILGLCPNRQYEGQAASELEFLAQKSNTQDLYPVWLSSYNMETESPRKPAGAGFKCWKTVRVFDWEPVIRRLLGDFQDGVGREIIAARFHNTLAEAIVKMALSIGEEKVLLTGGCFQNKFLLERSIQRLQASGFKVYWHQRIPCNDGGIAAGQIVGALRQLKRAQSEKEKMGKVCA